MAARTSGSFSLLLIIFSASLIATASSHRIVKAIHNTDDYLEDSCVLTLYVKTGDQLKAGTDSMIGLTLAGSDGKGLKIYDIALWGGLMGRNYDYYERGNLDIFAGRVPCLNGPPCLLNLTSDSTGSFPDWFCSYVEASIVGPNSNCSGHKFSVQQWLSADINPKQLYAERNNCSSNGDGVFEGQNLLRAARSVGGRREWTEEN